jgi:acyl carrier protein
MAINASLKEIFTQVFDLATDRINIDLTQKDIAKWDSLAQMQLVVALEQRFKINLELEEIVTMDSVKTIADILEKKGVNVYD